MTLDIVWLRDDFRLDDQAAIAAAADAPALFVYIHDQSPRNGRPLGGAAKWRLHRSLKAMERRLADKGGRLDVLQGPADETILALAKAAGASRVLWTRRYEGAAMTLDGAVEDAVRARGVAASSFNGRLIREPWEFDRGDHRLPRSFSAYWRRRTVWDMPAAQPAPARLIAAQWPADAPERVPVDALRLSPTKPDWPGELGRDETPGEEGALAALRRFAREGLSGYADGRDLASRAATSRLSAHLRFGELSAIRAAGVVESAATRAWLRRDAEKFLSELGWRDFAALLLSVHPDLATEPLRPEFARFPFRDDEADFSAWRRGETGYPIVDAGMRQLWRTGFMPNRVRMVAASFLVKHLLIDWRRGEEWFWDRLLDADPASNPMNWQWVAGAGADTAPFFRIFNPELQGEKFDPDGAYVRQWVPELARLDPAHIHHPWRAPQAALSRAGLVLGKTYPRPIVDHAAARARALEAFDRIKAERAG